jgi:hypothetical protein
MIVLFGDSARDFYISREEREESMQGSFSRMYAMETATSEISSTVRGVIGGLGLGFLQHHNVGVGVTAENS